mmetsp:Transcript_21348/g.46122  ORF Transcript_21348/g.46122 Transcript_21348/m.46122 type:complete len:261 (+) Transcript_21348:3457-4239(+)
MTHISSTARLFRSRNGIATANNRHGTLILGQIGKHIYYRKSALAKGLHLEHTQRSIHDNCLAIGQELVLLGSRGRPVVQTHPSVRDGICRNYLCTGIGGKGISHDNVARQQDGLSELLGLGQDVLGGVDVVILNEGRANTKSLGLQKGEDHATSNYYLIALVQQRLEHSNLGRNLAAADNGSHGPLAAGDGPIQVLQFLGKQESAHRRTQELGNALSRRMGTMRSAERVVHKQIERSGELLNKPWLVLRLFLVEASVLEH